MLTPKEARLLADKVVVVTGAGSGLGKAYATHAARSGAIVFANDVNAESVVTLATELAEEGLEVMPVPGDVSDWERAGEMIGRAVKQHGRIDGLVNNAGVFYVAQPWEDDPEQIARLIRINLLGVIYCGLQAIRVMVKQRHGSIVNVTSGAQLGIPGMGAYGASKGGVASLCYSWALDLRDKGIRVNAVSPLATTPMGQHGRPSNSRSRPPLPAPEHMAPLVTYLLSDLSNHLNGQVLRLEGPELSILRHPSIPEMRLSQGEWTSNDIAAAISGPLKGEIRHVGRD